MIFDISMSEETCEDFSREKTERAIGTIRTIRTRSAYLREGMERDRCHLWLFWRLLGGIIKGWKSFNLERLWTVKKTPKKVNPGRTITSF